MTFDPSASPPDERTGYSPPGEDFTGPSGCAHAVLALLVISAAAWTAIAVLLWLLLRGVR